MSRMYHVLCSSGSSALSDSHALALSAACQRVAALNMLDDISRDLGVRWFRATLSYINCTHDSFCTLTSHSVKPSHVHMLTQEL